MDQDMSLRDATAELGLESTRLVRLGWYLRIGSGEKCIPHKVIALAKTEESEEARYRLVRQWLLRHVGTRALPDA